MTNSVNNREIVLDILMEINEKEQFLHVLLNDALKKYQYLEKNERGFISRLVRGTLEWRITLDYVIDQVSTVPVRKMKPLIRNLMRMSVYQMMYMEQIPVSAICNEGVKLAEKRGFRNLKAFVNGVLRNISRGLPDMKLPEQASIRYSMPDFLVDMWYKAYGREKTDRMLEAFLEEKTLSVITNTLKITPEELEEQLTKEGVAVKAAPYIPNAFLLSGINYFDELTTFQKGFFQIQDISSMIAGLAAAPDKDDYVIDVCAAPGGKSIFAAISMKGEGIVDSRDLTPNKVEQINENVKCLGLTNVKTSVMDALVKDEASINKADVLIADLPCSGLGIIGRKPDIKYNVTKEKLKDIVTLQKKILDVIVDYVKPGGYMVFSTCTLNPYENEENVKYLCTKGFETVDLTKEMPSSVTELLESSDEKIYAEACMKKGYLTLLPGTYECDGFFVAKLRKK